METPHQHTPGPWHLTRDQRGMPAVYVTPLYYGVLDASAPINADANARLIAAAPELLKIAQAYRNLLRTMAHTEGEVATFEHIESIIAKATTPTA